MNANLTYSQCGDYYIPDLTISESQPKPLGKYGRMRKNYLREHRQVLWKSMILSETLYPHLREIDETASHYPNMSNTLMGSTNNTSGTL